MHKRMSSRGDEDHIGDSITLINNFKVKKVIFNCGEFNDLEKELIKLLDKKKNIDNSIRKITPDKTIGLIICKKDNKYVIEYSSDKRILSREYELI